MPLLAYNKTTSPLVLAAGNPAPTLPASPSGGTRGVAYNVTGELRPDTTVDNINGVSGGLLGADFTAIQVQVTAGDVDFEWTSSPEYLTTGLTIGGPSAGSHASSHENGGGDEISVAGLSGLLADAQTPDTHASSHESGGGDAIELTPDMNAVNDVTGLSMDAVLRVQIPAGAGGSADDVVIYNANSPFLFRILDVQMIVATAVGGSTVQLQDATGGAGNALSDAFDTASTGRKRDTGTGISNVTKTLAAGGTLSLRRSDSGVAGEIIIWLRKETT